MAIFVHIADAVGGDITPTLTASTSARALCACLWEHQIAEASRSVRDIDEPGAIVRGAGQQ